MPWTLSEGASKSLLAYFLGADGWAAIGPNGTFDPTGDDAMGLITMATPFVQKLKQIYGANNIKLTAPGNGLRDPDFNPREHLVAPIQWALSDPVNDEILPGFQVTIYFTGERTMIPQWSGGNYIVSTEDIAIWCSIYGLFEDSDFRQMAQRYGRAIFELLADAYTTSISGEGGIPSINPKTHELISVEYTNDPSLPDSGEPWQLRGLTAIDYGPIFELVTQELRSVDARLVTQLVRAERR